MTFDGGETFGLRLLCRGWIITAVNWFSLPFCTKVFCFPSGGNSVKKKQKRVYRWLLDWIQKYLQAVNFYISASISELTSLASRLSLSWSLVPCPSTRIFKMNKSSARQFLQGMIQREPAGDRCSRTPCWQVAKLLKDSSNSKAGRFEQPIRRLRTYVHGWTSSITLLLKTCLS